MSAKEELVRMREEIALKEREAEYQDALEKVHGSSPTKKDWENYGRLKNEFAAARTAFKVKHPAKKAGPGDAIATPKTVGATSTVKGEEV